MKKISLTILMLMGFGVANAQTIGGTHNTSFAYLAADGDQSGVNEPVCLYSDQSYTVQKDGVGTITIIGFLSQQQAESQWPDPLKTTSVPECNGLWRTPVEVFVNGVHIGRLEFSQSTGHKNDGTSIFGSPTTSLTFPLEVTKGPLTVEIWTPDTRNEADPNIAKRYSHSIPGMLSYSLNLPADLTNEFDKITNKITALETDAAALENDLNFAKGKISTLENQQIQNETDMANILTQINNIKTDISLIQQKIADNYNELKQLIADNAEAIQDNKDRIDALEQALAALSNKVSDNYNSLLLLIQNNEAKNKAETDKIREEMEKLHQELVRLREQANQTSKDFQAQIDALDQRITKVKTRSDDRDWWFAGGAFAAGLVIPGLFDAAFGDDPEATTSGQGDSGYIQETTETQPANGGWIQSFK